MTTVKKTSNLEKVIALLAPHRCYGCKSEGSLLCESCTENVVTNEDLHCFSCERPTSEQAICSDCLKRSVFNGLFVAGSYEGTLEKVLHAYKFNRARSAFWPLTDLLDTTLPYFDDAGTVIIGLPTVHAHIRQRGYDQVALMVRRLGSLRSFQVVRALNRAHNKRQLGANRKVRVEQARSAYQLRGGCDLKDKTVILVDDVMTTGASLEAAAKLLRQAGATKIYGLVVAQQPLM